MPNKQTNKNKKTVEPVTVVEPVAIQAQAEESALSSLPWADMLDGDTRTLKVKATLNISDVLIEHLRRHSVTIPSGIVKLSQEATELETAPDSVVANLLAEDKGLILYYEIVQNFFSGLQGYNLLPGTGKVTAKSSSTGERVLSCKNRENPAIFLNGLYSPAGEKDDFYKKEGASNPTQIKLCGYDKSQRPTSVRTLIKVLREVGAIE